MDRSFPRGHLPLFLIALGVIGCEYPTVAATPAGHTTILVVDKATGTPLSGAGIWLSGATEGGTRQFTTDIKGLATLTDLGAAPSDVRILRIGYRRQTIRVDPSRYTAPVLVRLDRAGLALIDCVVTLSASEP